VACLTHSDDGATLRGMSDILRRWRHTTTTLRGMSHILRWWRHTTASLRGMFDILRWWRHITKHLRLYHVTWNEVVRKHFCCSVRCSQQVLHTAKPQGVTGSICVRDKTKCRSFYALCARASQQVRTLFNTALLKWHAQQRVHRAFPLRNAKINGRGEVP
jgi:hypothetical protein